METKNLGDMVADPKNPRRISKQDFQALVDSLKQFGDLSGIVFNRTTGQLVGGHQRIEAFKKAGVRHNATIEHDFGEPNRQGTIAIGNIELDGELFKYREVMWPLERQRAANIAANRIQGEFDLDLLAEANQFLEDTSPDLLDFTGQTLTERNSLKRRYGPDPEGEQKQPEPKNDDGTRPVEFRMSEPQINRVVEALGAMKRKRQLTMETNKDLDGNALYYICDEWLAAQPETNDAPPAPPAD